MYPLSTNFAYRYTRKSVISKCADSAFFSSKLFQYGKSKLQNNNFIVNTE